MLHEGFIYAAEIMILLGGVLYIKGLIDRLKKTHMMTISQATGDSESVVIQANFSKAESLEDRKQHMDELFGLLQHRRDYNHQQWLKIKAEAEAEAKAKQEGLKPVS